MLTVGLKMRGDVEHRAMWMETIVARVNQVSKSASTPGSENRLLIMTIRTANASCYWKTPDTGPWSDQPQDIPTAQHHVSSLSDPAAYPAGKAQMVQRRLNTFNQSNTFVVGQDKMYLKTVEQILFIYYCYLVVLQWVIIYTFLPTKVKGVN
jgi:hypothetical protein